MGHADAVLVTCIDFRFWERVSGIIKRMYGIRTMDLIAFPGGVKNIIEDGAHSILLQNIRLSVDLHHVGTIVIVNHHDCGAYGGFSSFGTKEKQLDAQRTQLEQARDLLHQEFPDKTIIIAFADLAGDNVEVHALENKGDQRS